MSIGIAASAEAPAGNADLAKSGKSGAVLHPDPRLPLKKGMMAKDVKERWGEPASVEPFSSADGKAKVWTYYYTIRDDSMLVVNGTVDQITYIGPNEGMQNRPQLTYGMQHTLVQQVVKLLLYDDMLVSWKKSIERTERHE